MRYHCKFCGINVIPSVKDGFNLCTECEIEVLPFAVDLDLAAKPPSTDRTTQPKAAADKELNYFPFKG